LIAQISEALWFGTNKLFLNALSLEIRWIEKGEVDVGIVWKSGIWMWEVWKSPVSR